jgi:hypothetical protein
MPRGSLINKALGLGAAEPVETYHNSPHLLADLHIPEGTTGRLPRAARTRAGLEAEEIEDLGETGKRHGGGRPAGRGRGARDDGAVHGRGGHRSEDAPRSEGERPRRTRSRRRTRGGKAAEGPQG